jgi:hypothetical protein
MSYGKFILGSFEERLKLKISGQILFVKFQNAQLRKISLLRKPLKSHKNSIANPFNPLLTSQTRDL